MEILAWPIGTAVEIGSKSDPVKGEVTGIHIEQDGHLTYRIAWWGDSTRTVAWLDCCEIRFPDDSTAAKQKIGFHAKG